MFQLSDGDDKTTMPDDENENENKSNQSSLDELRQRLALVRQKRRQVAKFSHDCQKQYEIVVAPRCQELQVQRQWHIERYQSLIFQRQSMAQYLDLAMRWNVLNDCFHIWHQGSWATINGARFGGDAPQIFLGSHSNIDQAQHHALPASAAAPFRNGGQPGQSSRQHQQLQQQYQAPPRHRYFPWSSVAPAPQLPNDDNDNDNDTATTASASMANPSTGPAGTSTTMSTTLGGPAPSSLSNASATAAANTSSKVSWPERNAAIGHVVLLLQLLTEKSGWTMTHQLIPRASTSQIGIRRKISKSTATLFGVGSGSGSGNNVEHIWQPPIIHNLYFDDTVGGFSLNFFKGNTNAAALRQYNIGLSALLECVLELQSQLHDKTIVLPHTIQPQQSNEKQPQQQSHDGSMMIGGLILTYDNSSSSKTSTDFTRACKYLLTNVKWLVAYVVKHHVER